MAGTAAMASKPTTAAAFKGENELRTIFILFSPSMGGERSHSLTQPVSRLFHVLHKFCVHIDFLADVRPTTRTRQPTFVRIC